MGRQARAVHISRSVSTFASVALVPAPTISHAECRHGTYWSPPRPARKTKPPPETGAGASACPRSAPRCCDRRRRRPPRARIHEKGPTGTRSRSGGPLPAQSGPTASMAGPVQNVNVCAPHGCTPKRCQIRATRRPAEATGLDEESIWECGNVERVSMGLYALSFRAAALAAPFRAKRSSWCADTPARTGIRGGGTAS
jgi:hypothetical protein